MRLIRFFSIVMCVVVTVGCANVGFNGSDGESANNTQQDEGSAPVSGGSLRLCMNAPTTLNPLKNEDVTVDSVLKIVYEPLFNIINDMSVEPNIGESIEISENTVKIKVKDNIYWQDGKAIGADDVIYSLETIQEAGANSLYKSSLMNVRYFEQTGDKTLSIYYSEPVGAANYNFTFPVIPKHYFKENDDPDMNPMGSGSFALDTYHQGRELILKAVNGLKGKPYIDSITVMVINGEQNRLSAIESGVTDVCSVDVDDLEQIKGTAVENTRRYTSNLFEFVGFNTRKPIFATANARQLIANLIPTDDIIQGIYVNNMTKSITPINPDSIYSSSAGLQSYSYNTETANTLLNALGLTKSDFSFKILVNNDNSCRMETAKLLCQSFNDFGMNVTIDATDYDQYIKKLQTGDFDLYIGCVEFTPNMNIYQLVGSTGSINYTGYVNPQMDTYTEDINASMSLDDYKNAISELNKYLSYELPVAGIGFKRKVLVCSQRIENANPAFGNCYYNISQWYIKS